MKSVTILSTGSYLPKVKMENVAFAKALNVTEEYLIQRTGIRTRYFVKDETMCTMATKAAQKAIEKANIPIEEIDLIIVATTTTKQLMPGISYLVQKQLGIKQTMCLDVLAGCSGYINAFDIARNYIALGKVKIALIIGVDILSQVIDKKDIGTAIVLSDGAGATIIKAIGEEKRYESYLQSDGTHSDILTYTANSPLYMDGKAIYKYAVTETVKNVEQLLEKSKQSLEQIKYIIPHQSNLKILKSIQNRLSIAEEKMYSNIETVGNTFCASIPIALDEMLDKQLLHKGDKVILLGYGGGLNTGSILLEI
ncbi:MAG: 3-oxoacyl-ACP synthase III family protein [Clostridia bacterium]